MPHFRFRALTEADEPQIRDFFDANPDPHVMLRPDAMIRAAIDNSSLFVAESVTASEAPVWAGVSGVYTFTKYAGMILKEAGGSLVARPYRGFGIHKVFHVLRSVNTRVWDSGFHHYFVAIVPPNKESKDNLDSFKFREWKTPPKDLQADRQPYAPPGKSIEYFELPLDEFPGHAKRLLDYIDAGQIRTSRSTATIEIATRSAGKGRPLVEALAKV